MTLFDRYIAVDWSAANSPRTGADSIWIAERRSEGLQPSVNPPTRHEATTLLIERVRAARARGERVFLGFDFVFGYPRGAARAIAGQPGWQAMWNAISEAVEDGPDNRSNRFEVAARFNRVLELEHFWGHPPHHRYAGLSPTRPTHGYMHIAERRLAEAQVKGPQPVWKLTGAGSVGSQSLLGIARLQQIRQAVPEAAVWPFDTDFERALKPVTMVEIYPSMLPLTGAVQPRDREQVEVSVERFAGLDRAGALGEFLSAPGTLRDDQRRDLVAEEGWIAGVGHEALLRDVPVGVGSDYLRDPDEIYRQSFATIRGEAKLSHLPPELRDIAVRMIHACGMVDLAANVVGTPALPAAVARALGAGAPIFCDSQMVAAGIMRRLLPKGSEIVVTLDDTRTPELARELGTTRSAAAVELWRERLGGAVVVIGNAPTALFHLLDLLDAGAPAPAGIIAAPVGFVGAAESKERLAATAPTEFVTVRGRRGGSAMAAAALNAILVAGGTP